MLSIRRFFDLLLLAGVIAGTLLVNYLINHIYPTRVSEPRSLVGLAVAIAIVVTSIALLYINQASETKKVIAGIREQYREEHERCQLHWQAKYALSEAKIVKLEAARKVQLSELAKLVELIHEKGTKTDVQAIKVDAIAQMIVLLQNNVPFESLKGISPLALRDVVKKCFDDEMLDIVDGPKWQRELVRFAMQDPREPIPVATPSDTSS